MPAELEGCGEGVYVPPTCELAGVVEEAWLACVGKWMQGMKAERSIGLCVRCLAVCLAGTAWSWGLACQDGGYVPLLATSSACLPRATPHIAVSTRTEQKQYRNQQKRFFPNSFPN